MSHPDAGPAKPAQGGLLRPLARWLHGSARALSAILLASLALTLTGLAAPVLTGVFIDHCLAAGWVSWAAPLLAGLALTAAVRAALFWLQQYLLLRLETRLALESSYRFFHHVLRLPATFFVGRSRGEIGSRVAINDRIARLTARVLTENALNVVTAILYLAVMASIDVPLAAIGVGIAALNFLVLWRVSRWRKGLNRQVLEERAQLTATAFGGLQAIETVKATGSESDFFARWAGVLARVLEVGQRMDTSSLLLSALPNLLSALSTVIILWVGAGRVMDEKLTIGMLVAFQSLMISFLGPIDQFVSLGKSLQEVEGELRRLNEVTDHPTDPELATALPVSDWAGPPRLAGRLEVRKVTFRYPGGPPLLEKFSLKVSPGTRVALVGASGSGKSTVARLVCGVYQPGEGEVLLDGTPDDTPKGTPRGRVPRAVLADSLAVVDQEFFLFEGSVRDVLTMWDATVPEEDIVRAAKDACIHQEIAARPGAYGSRVEEGGANFSGGQRQRLEIARALVRNPSIVVLDEATSALDAATEGKVDENLRRRGCTCLIVAHRLSTIRDCDEIVVMDRGTIVQRGTHDELMDPDKDKDPTYRNLIRDGSSDDISNSPPAPAPPVLALPPRTPAALALPDRSGPPPPPFVADGPAASDPVERPVPGNAPLPLDDPGSVWQVIDGWADVFAVLSGPDGSAGPRVHLFRAKTGDHLFGVAAGADVPRLVAVGTVATRVRRLEREPLREELGSVAQPAQFAPLLDHWIRGLTAAVTRGRRPPRNAVPLVAGVSRTFKAGEFVAPSRGVVWVPVQRGLSFLGEESSPIGSGAIRFPVHAPAWLGAAADGQLLPRPTASVLADPEAWAGLERFHKIVLARLARQADEARPGQQDRQDRRTRQDERMLDDAQLGWDVDRPEEPDEDLAPGQQPDPLLAACRQVAAQLGVTVRNPPGVLERSQATGQTVATLAGWTFVGRPGEADPLRKAEPVEAIARASRLRVRRVRLEGDWWRRDNGPLVAFRQVDDRPLALLSVSPTRYEVVDTTTGERKPLTRAGAATIRLDRAFQFFRPFPARALSPWRLFVFSLAGTRRDWVFVFLLGLAGGVTALFPPVATGWVFDRIIPGAERNYLLLVILALTVVTVTGVLFRVARSVAILRLENRMDIGTQAGLWDRLLDLPPPFFRQYAVGDLAARVSGISSIRWLLTDAALSALLNLASSLVYFVLLAYYDLSLAGLAAGLFLLVLGVTVYAGLRQLPYQRRAHHARGLTSGTVLQLLTGLPRLQTADATTRALAVWARRFGIQRRLEYRARLIANALETFAIATPIGCTIILFAVVVMFPRPGLSLGVFLAFNVAFVRLMSSALAVSSTVAALIEVVPLYERVRPILDAVPEANAALTIPGDLKGEIEVRHVSFRYQADGPPVLDDVSLHIRPGEFVAFAGVSGAGKSTLMRILLGFEKPTAGAVFYDREDMSGLDVQSLRRQAGVVLQSIHPLPGTIRDNILGSAPLTEDDAWAAARLIGLEEYIRGLPNGMNTPIAEAGAEMSGGQRQLLMIARAIACRPRILFFDEATSALDNVTQVRVSGGLEALNTTRVVVAHRLSTVRNADRIYLVHNGRIDSEKDVGTYAELMERSERFRELVRRQQT